MGKSVIVTKTYWKKKADNTSNDYYIKSKLLSNIHVDKETEMEEQKEK